MTIDERLYEAGLAVLRVRPEKYETALRTIDQLEGARKDLEHRLDKFLAWLAKHERDDEEG